MHRKDKQLKSDPSWSWFTQYKTSILFGPTKKSEEIISDNISKQMAQQQRNRHLNRFNVIERTQWTARLCWQFEFVCSHCMEHMVFSIVPQHTEHTNTNKFHNNMHATERSKRRSACTNTTASDCDWFVQAVQFRVYIKPCTPFMFVSLPKLMWYRRHSGAHKFAQLCMSILCCFVQI